ncbi:hypothetical protein AAMO2058_000815500 [Amorphochlora amoebiformis]
MLADLVWLANTHINLISRKSNPHPEDIAFLHIDDCAPLLHTMKRYLPPQGVNLLDIGSGGGFPGLVIAISDPEIQVTLLDATNKKCEFLRSASCALDLSNTRILWSRAEQIGHEKEHRGRYEAVTARAVADLRVLIELALPFLRIDGHLFAMKGPRAHAEDEIKHATSALDTLGGSVQEIYEAENRGELIGSRTVIVIKKVRETPREYPRPPGAVRGRPIGDSQLRPGRGTTRTRGRPVGANSKALREAMERHISAREQPHKVISIFD